MGFISAPSHWAPVKARASFDCERPLWRSTNCTVASSVAPRRRTQSAPFQSRVTRANTVSPTRRLRTLSGFRSSASTGPVRFPGEGGAAGSWQNAKQKLNPNNNAAAFLASMTPLTLRARNVIRYRPFCHIVAFRRPTGPAGLPTPAWALSISSSTAETQEARMVSKPSKDLSPAHVSAPQISLLRSEISQIKADGAANPRTCFSVRAAYCHLRHAPNFN